MNNSKTCALRAITVGAAMILSFGSASAFADTSSQFVSDGAHTYVVRFSDLDVNKIEGAAVLYRRLSQAAGVVCDSLQSRDLTINAQYQTCKKHAVAAAVASVGRPVLSQYHESFTGGAKNAMVQLAKAD